MESAEEFTLRLARRIGGITGNDLRAAYLRRTLLDIGPEAAADVLLVTVVQVEARDKRHAELLQGISLALTQDGTLELRQAVRAILESRGELSVAGMLGPVPDPEQDDDAMRVPDFGMGRPVTLGERKSLARKRDRDLIARVIRDPHPDVIRILLGNPAVVEQDVLRLAARRPVLAEVLREVFRSSRWIVRYHIKAALALNPYTPIDVSLQVAAHLTQQDRRRVARSADLPDLLRSTCGQEVSAHTVH